MDISSIKNIARTAEFAALIALSGILVIPMGPVPITLQVFFVLLAGLFLGARAGMAAVGLFILAGAAGIPVFAGGKAGLGVLAGPTAGYMLGFLAMAAIAAPGARCGALLRMLLLLAAVAADHACGIAGLAATLGKSLAAAATIDLAFIPGDVAKAVLASLVWSMVLKRRRAAGDHP